MKRPIIWSISGADCSGGAGIAADIKTGHQLGVEVCHLITANTVQNSNTLVSVNPVEVEILQQQLDTLVEDKPPAVVKIGLLVNPEQLAWLCRALRSLKQALPQLTVVYDPVAQASVGGRFSTLSRAGLSQLLPLVDVITPNLLEAQTLSGIKTKDAGRLANAIAQLGVNSVIIKGGHNEDHNCIDYCLHRLKTKEAVSYQLTSTRVYTSHSHGGGCSFASAIASLMAKGFLLRDAFTLTKAFINQGLKAHQGAMDYYGAFDQLGFPKQAEDFPKVSSELASRYSDLPAFQSLRLGNKLGLYPVVDSIAWLEKLLPLGLEIIQLRLKNYAQEALDDLIAQAVELCRDSNTRLFINDYWQLAIKHGAYGVHIGQEDLQEADLQQIQQAGLRLGISTHGCYEFLLAQQLKPSYLAIGAIFATKTKDMTGQIQGLDNLKQILTLAENIPVVAIGGINLERAPQVWQTGVDSLAVVTAITEAEDPNQAVRDFQVIME